MKLSEKHIENLRALVAEPEKGILRSRLPNPRQAQALIKNGLAEALGYDWISHVFITDEGRNALKEIDAG